MSNLIPWVPLKDVHKQYGFSSLEAARNAIAAGRFPVQTYKLGRLIVIDLAVHERFFQAHREAGLRALEDNLSLSPQQHGSNDES
jgi:hypothetical protein